METLTILIADSNDDFRQALSASLQNTFCVYVAETGTEALQMLKEIKPDIVVLDLMLPELDGISLLHKAADAGIFPMVLATSRLTNDYITHAVKSLGVSYLLEKPCYIPSTVDRIMDLSQQLHRSDAYAADPRMHVSNMLLTLGVSTKLRGYTYLREAILLMSDSPALSITKELYPSVGALCNDTAVHVERSIRSAIDKAWQNRNDETWSQFFLPDAKGVLPRPSNADFISRLSDRLSLNQMRFPLH